MFISLLIFPWCVGVRRNITKHAAPFPWSLLTSMFFVGQLLGESVARTVTNECLGEWNKDHQRMMVDPNVYDHSEFKVISNCCYNNCCRTNCGTFTWIYLNLPDYLNLPKFTWFYLNLPEFTEFCLTTHEFTGIYLNLPEFTSIYLTLTQFT